MPDKKDLLAALAEALTAELEAAISASKDAASYATDEESRASSKWDTQGLEASYLAAGQAQQARELEQARQSLHSLILELTAAKDYAAIGALVSCSFARGGKELFWLVPSGAGGRELRVDGKPITCLNAQSPLGRELLGKGIGDTFKLTGGAAGTIADIR